MVVTEQLCSLPAEITVLVEAAAEEDLGMVARLVAASASGENRFDQPGEVL